jgi:hypothetical protein
MVSVIQETITQPVSLTKRAFAVRHSVSIRTLDHWRLEGLPCLVVSRRKILFPLPVADKWVTARFLVASGKTMARLAARVGGGVA